MIIGIDIDDTLVSSKESFYEIMKKYNVDFKKGWRENWTKQERAFIYKHYINEILMNAKIKDGAKETIDYLNNLGYKLVIITARNNNTCEGIEEFTKNFLIKEKININEFYLGEKIKSDIARSLKLDLMIDDNISVYDNMKKEGIDCILFGDKIKTWVEVKEYIERRNNG